MLEDISEFRPKIIWPFFLHRTALRDSPGSYFSILCPGHAVLRSCCLLRSLQLPCDLLFEPLGVRFLQHNLHIRAVSGRPAVRVHLHLTGPQEHLEQILFQVDIGNIPDPDRVFLLIHRPPLDHDSIFFDAYVGLRPDKDPVHNACRKDQKDHRHDQGAPVRHCGQIFPGQLIRIL